MSGALAFHERFLAHFSRGVMKPHLYEIEFHLPRGVTDLLGIAEGGISAASMRTAEQTLNSRGGINIKCHTATFPQRSLQTTELRQNAAPFRTPISSVYDPVTFSFYADATADSRIFFDVWQRATVNVRSNTMNFYDEYTSDIKMFVLNEAEKRTYGVKLFEAYPLSVGAMDVSFSNNNNYQTVYSTVAYKRWEQILV